LADVAAEDAGAERRPQIARDGAAVLDREIGDAAARVEQVRPDEGAGRAGVEACRACAAAVPRWLLARGRLQLDVEDELAEQEIRAEPGGDEQGVLADEAEPGPLGQLALEDRRGVH